MFLLPPLGVIRVIIDGDFMLIEEALPVTRRDLTDVMNLPVMLTAVQCSKVDPRSWVHMVLETFDSNMDWRLHALLLPASRKLLLHRLWNFIAGEQHGKIGFYESFLADSLTAVCLDRSDAVSDANHWQSMPCHLNSRASYKQVEE